MSYFLVDPKLTTNNTFARFPCNYICIRKYDHLRGINIDQYGIIFSHIDISGISSHTVNISISKKDHLKFLWNVYWNIRSIYFIVGDQND